jgi:hypothetical protein
MAARCRLAGSHRAMPRVAMGRSPTHSCPPIVAALVRRRRSLNTAARLGLPAHGLCPLQRNPRPGTSLGNRAQDVCLRTARAGASNERGQHRSTRSREPPGARMVARPRPNPLRHPRRPAGVAAISLASISTAARYATAAHPGRPRSRLDLWPAAGGACAASRPRAVRNSRSRGACSRELLAGQLFHDVRDAAHAHTIAPARITGSAAVFPGV